jgi:DNA processing protein
LSRGPHGLIKQGAKLVETVEDIVEELLPQLEESACGVRSCEVLAEQRSRLTAARTPAGGLGNAEALNLSGLSAEEKCVLTLITREPVTIDALTARTGLPPAVVAGALLELELKEVVRQMPGQRYYLVK